VVSSSAKPTLPAQAQAEHGACQVSSQKVASATKWLTGAHITGFTTDAAQHGNPPSCTYGDYGGKHGLTITSWIGASAHNKPTETHLGGKPPTPAYVEKVNVLGATDAFFYGSDANHLDGIVLTKAGVTVEVNAAGENLSRGALVTLAQEAADCLNGCN
jgi:hypothetical protein